MIIVIIVFLFICFMIFVALLIIIYEAYQSYQTWDWGGIKQQWAVLGVFGEGVGYQFIQLLYDTFSS